MDSILNSSFLAVKPTQYGLTRHIAALLIETNFVLR
jgi:hypothetical protein